MKSYQRRRILGFTLLELLTVIAIISILAALVLRTAAIIQNKAARERAKAEIASFTLALDNFRIDNGEYPVATNDDSSDSITVPTNGSTILLTNLLPATGKVYQEFTKTQTNSSGQILDPFGEPYGYRCPATNNTTNYFDLWSRCGTTNTNVWINNW